MTHRSTMRALILSLLLVAGCRDNSPIISAEAYARDASARPLSARQLQLLNTWLVEHRAGWSALVLATPPKGAFTVTVHRQSGETARIDFYSQPGWQGSLMYWANDPDDNMQGGFVVEQVSALRTELEQPQ